MKFFFKVNFSSEIGLGHIKRCINLANNLQSKFSLTFLVINNDLKNQNIIDKNKFKVIYFKNNNEILKKSKKIFKRNHNNFLIIDDYYIDYKWEKKIYKFVNKLFIIDDYINRKHYCDYYLNQNVINKKIKKNINIKSSRTPLFLGSKYALLHKNYNYYYKKKEKKNSLKKILISFGGTDEENLSEKILNLLVCKKYNKLEIQAVIPDLKKINLLKNKYKNYKNIKIIRRVDSLAKIIYNSDLIIGSAGSTSLERICLFKPSLAFCLTNNQKLLFNQLKKKNLIIDGGDIYKLNQNKFDHFIDKIKLKYLSENIEKNFIFVDGLGAKRIAEIILNRKKKFFSFKKANKKDVYLYYNWLNDESVRKYSLNTKFIEFRVHKKWFKKQLQYKKKNILYIMYLNNLPVGQIRTNIKNFVGKIDYSVDADFRGKGFGYIIIKKALAILKKENLKKISAVVKKNNINSIKIFKKLKFNKLENKKENNIKTFEITLKNY